MARPRGTRSESSAPLRPSRAPRDTAHSDDLPPASTPAREAPLPKKRGGARPGAGRPAGDPALVRSERLVVKVSPSERAELEAWAARREEPLVRAVRETVLREARRGGA